MPPKDVFSGYIAYEAKRQKEIKKATQALINNYRGKRRIQ